MTNANGEPPMSRAATAFAHSLPALVLAALLFRAAYLLNIKLPAEAWLDAGGSMLVLFGAVALAWHVKVGGLCLRCMRSAPLDPQRSVNRSRFFLWQLHWPRRLFWRVFLACEICVLASHLVNGIWVPLLKVPLDVLFFSNFWGYRVHHRLTPWCPYCRGWDDGGEPELIPDPDPVEKGVR